MTAHDSGPSLDLMPPDERRELISAYLDGELPAEDALRVSTWLATNPEALREVEHMRHLWDLLEVYEDERVPEDFAAGVMESVGLARSEQREGRLIQLAWYRRPLATAAAVILAVGATVFVMSNRQPTDGPTQEPAAEVTYLEDVDAEFLEHVDLLVELDDDTFEDFLDSEEIADAGLGG